MYGVTVVREGERVAVWDRRGGLRLIDGPRRVWVWGQQVEALTRYAAGTGEYLVITYRDGSREHLRGPAAVWGDPVAHAEIRTEKALAISANEAVVLYRQEAGAVSRRVVRGPALYMPGVNEWLHAFSWHGADPRDPRRKAPNMLRFHKLRVIPDQMYVDVPEVRTADDALLTIKLMIFFELTDIERMLDQTHDPVADFLNAVSADVIDFAAALRFEAFKEHTEALNALATYGQLVQRGARIGYRINKVVYRGYHASDALQGMHDRAIETRTQLRLEAETEEQAQALADLRLQREQERSARRQAMEAQEQRHRTHLEGLAHQEQLRRREAEQQQDADGQRVRHAIEEQHQQAMHREQLAFLRGMQGLKVDLTRYLVAQYQHPDRLIRIEEGQPAQVHLHE